MDTTTATIYQDILRRLAQVRRQENTQRILSGGLVVLTACCAAIVLVPAMEALFRPGSLPRTIMFWGTVSGLALLFLWRIGIPLARRFGYLRSEPDDATARRVGGHFPELRDRLLNLLELYRDPHAPQLYSPDLIDASFVDLKGAVSTSDFPAIVDRKPLRRALRWSGAVGLLGILSWVLFPALLGGGVYRLVHHADRFDPPPRFVFHVEPGNAEFVKGSNVEIVARVEGPSPEMARLLIRPQGQIAEEIISLAASAPGVFRHTITGIRISTTYALQAEDVRSDEYRLRVTDRPFIRMLRLYVTPPRYAHQVPLQLDDHVGDVTALKGTEIRFDVEASKELQEAEVRLADSSRVALRVSGRRAGGPMRLMRETTYRISLRDTGGMVNADPITYTLRMIPDAYPAVRVMMPGANLDVAGDESLNMLIHVSDDFGFSSLRLAYRLTHSRYEQPEETPRFLPVPIPAGVVSEGLVPFVWDVKTLRLAPEDVVTYHVEVQDNDAVSGPKSAVSESYTLRLPSLEEVFAGIDRTQETSVDRLEESLKDAEDARKELEELNRDIKKNQSTVQWEDQKKAAEVAKRYQEIQKKLDDVKRAVDDVTKEMEKNKVLSPETLEKYQELQQLMEQMNSPEFAEAMKKLQQSMQQTNPEALKQALQQFTFSEENFRKSIERTMNLLKRIQIEQKVDEALRRAGEMQRQQEKLNAEAEKLTADQQKEMQDLARQQKELQEQAANLEKALAELKQKMEEFPADMPLTELQKAMEEMAQSGLEEQLKQSAQAMEAGEMQQAQSRQRQATQAMGQLMQRLQQMRDAMQSNQQRQIVNAMRSAMQDLIDLSKRQEDLKNESRSLEPNSQRFRRNAQDQMSVLQDLAGITHRLSALSQKTFGITPEMGKSIGDAIRRMNDAMQALEQRNGASAAEQQGAAMGSLNETAQQLGAGISAMMEQGGQGMGMSGFLARLQQLAGMQQGINESSQGMSQQQAAEMARLAGEQGMVRKSLEQLAREAANAGQMSKLLGDLNRVAQDMREVQTDLAQGNLQPETVRKQERILSRLLDAQRSMRERDFEKRRRAETARTPSRPSPPPIDLTTQEGRSRLQRDLLKALEEGYARDYEDLIRKYFEALEQK